MPFYYVSHKPFSALNIQALDQPLVGLASTPRPLPQAWSDPPWRSQGCFEKILIGYYALTLIVDFI